MASLNPPLNLSEWQSLSSQNPTRAGRELFQRLQSAVSPAQSRAIFTETATEAQLIAQFERVANTIAPLAGVPYALKDIFFTANDPLRAGSNFPPGILPVQTRDSKLPHALRGFGMVMAGKTHLFEFAYGLTGENEFSGHCEHPLYPDRTSGGSSSGSAAAVAAGIVPFAVGTDTGGSIRVPAAFCGLYGFRTNAHHSMIADAFPLAPSFDTAGWFARTGQDILTAHRYLIGRTTLPERTPRGCFLDFEALSHPADEDVAQAYRATAEKWAFRADPQTSRDLTTAFAGAEESYAVLQSIEAYQVHQPWLDAHRDYYSQTVWSRIDRGRRWAPEQQQKAAAQRTLLQHVWTRFFKTYDFLVLPIAPFPALRKTDCTDENRRRLLQLTTPVSLAGLATVVLPITLPSGLTTGLQIVLSDPLSSVIPWILKR